MHRVASRPSRRRSTRNWFRIVGDNIEAILAPNGSFFLDIEEHSEDGELLKIMLDTSASASTRLRARDIVIGHTANAIFIRGRATWIADPCPFSQ
jgi:hypothetical protein